MSGSLRDLSDCFSTIIATRLVEDKQVAPSLWRESVIGEIYNREQARIYANKVMKRDSMRRCVYRKQLDLETPVATRGPNFPVRKRIEWPAKFALT